MTETTLLLQGGTLLLHDDETHVVPTVSDILIKGHIIAKIGKDIQPEAGVKVIDCRGKIVSPGFIDTHRHLYQTQYKGLHANHTLLEYLPTGNLSAGIWTKEDLFWGQLAGALESLDAGTTTVVDHSSCNNSPDHPQAAIQAILSAGIRAVYCYTPLRKLKSTNPWSHEDDVFSEQNLSTYRALAKGGPYGNGTVRVGYAMDNIYLPGEVIKPYYTDLRDPAKGKAHLITTHTSGGLMMGQGPTVVQILDGHGLLGPDVLISHPNRPAEGDGARFRSSGAQFSSTANTELQMGSFPVALRDDDHYRSGSLGIDCHSCGAAGIPGQMRLLLQAARAERGAALTARGLWSRHTGPTAEQVYNLGTLGGARAAGLAGDVGRLREGLRADIVVLDGSSPAMLAAAAEDPVAAVVFHSGPGDVETVIVDGVVRKEGGRLLDVVVAAAPVEGRGAVAPGTRLTWADVGRRVLESRQSLKDRLEGVDYRAGEEYVISSMHLDTTIMLEAQDDA